MNGKDWWGEFAPKMLPDRKNTIWIDLLQFAQLISTNKMSLRLILIFLVLACTGTGCDSNQSATETVHPGKEIYFKYCGTCHGPGVADAPKFGVVEEWQVVMEKGRDELLRTTIEGIPPGMPIKGLCMNCTDQQLMDAIDYMLEAVEKVE